MDRRTILAPLLAAGLGLSWVAGAAGQSPDVLDSLSRPTADPAAGTGLARRQIAAGDLTMALATLERVILEHPGNGEARLLHAGLLCRLDDRAGSLVEFDRLRGWDFPPELWREANEPCQAMRRGD
jgi:hypothetical protein